MLLGKPKGSEVRMIIIFGIVLLLWISRNWINQWMGYIFLTDPMIAIIGGVSLFIIPAPESEGQKTLLDWGNTRSLPWGILLLFGGALSMAGALGSTGTIQLVGDLITANSHLGHFWLFVICIVVMVFITELMGGTALTAVFVPVLFVVAINVGMDPILLALPVTLASNCSFMLPIATPPNAIVFSTGHLQVRQMIRSGWAMNIIAIVILIIITQLLGPLIF